MRYTRMLLLVLLCGLTFSLTAQTTGPANGALYIHGGGRVNMAEFVTLVKTTTGKSDPVVRVITTAQGRRRIQPLKNGEEFPVVIRLREQHGLSDVQELYTLSPREGNDPKFCGQIDDADAVYMTGGNQSFLTDAFLETETLSALQRLLERGGVIGGASAGAQVQSSFMTRGDFKKREILGDKKHQIGFGFVTHSAFDVHVEERDRENDLYQVFNARKRQLQDRSLATDQLLGIGIDQGTAAIVIQNKLSVSGPGLVRIFDPQQWSESRKPFYLELADGDTFDLKTRRQ
ncbi:cyanophycinase [Opitutaceae bacterium]|nr:cyanophycinase [Opitutaceae bacterium]